MSAGTSLRARIGRLEKSRRQVAALSIGERLQRAEARVRSMSAQEAAAERCRTVARDLASLAEPDRDDRFQRAYRRLAHGHLRAMASLTEPDLPEAHPAWREQQTLREQARRHLADVQLSKSGTVAR